MPCFELHSGPRDPLQNLVVYLEPAKVNNLQEWYTTWKLRTFTTRKNEGVENPPQLIKSSSDRVSLIGFNLGETPTDGGLDL